MGTRIETMETDSYDSYVIFKVRFGNERRVAALIEEHLSRGTLVPTLSGTETGKIVYPGYVFVQCRRGEDIDALKNDLNVHDSKGYLVRSGMNYKNFEDRLSSEPYFLDKRDIDILLKDSESTGTQAFGVGDEIQIVNGLLKDCSGVIRAVNNTDPLSYKVSVRVGQTEIFTTIEGDKIMRSRRND